MEECLLFGVHWIAFSKITVMTKSAALYMGLAYFRLQNIYCYCSTFLRIMVEILFNCLFLRKTKQNKKNFQTGFK